MNHTLASTAQPGLNPTHRQQPPPNVPNASAMIQNQNGGAYPLSQSIPNNGMTGYGNAQNNAQHAQSYGGFAVSQHPTINLHKDALVYQHPGRQHYDVYQTNYAQYPAQNYQAPPQFYYPQNVYPTMGTISQPIGYAPMPQQLPMESQYNSYQAVNNAQYNPGYQMAQTQPAQPQAQPATTQPSIPAQPVAKRERKLLVIVDPITGEDVIKSNEIAAVVPPVEASAPVEQQPPKEEPVEKNGEEVRKGFIIAIANAAKKDDVKEPIVKAETPIQNVPKIVQQPAPASSAPPPTINISDEPKIQQIGVKAASMEPAIHIEAPSQNNEVHSIPERSASPALAPTPETKEQQQEDEDVEKLLDLENRFKDLYATKSEEIESQVYGLEVLAMIHEIVKCYKKTLPPVDLDFLKKKGLDIQSELPQQMQGRSKYTNITNAFNPGWNSNQQIVGNRNKLYIGRHSDNKNMRKKGLPTRASYDRTPRQPPPPPVLDLRKADNAWKPKRRGEVEVVNEDEKKYEVLRKDIRSLLNKITPTNYDELIQDFFRMDVGQNEQYQQIAIELIFDKAVEEPKFCSLYTKLCKEQVDRGKRTAGSFFYTLVRKIQATFEGDSAFDKSIKELQTQLAEESDEKKKPELNEKLELLMGKEKRYILGNIKFISHLYTVDLISDKVIAFCLSKLHQMFDDTSDEIYVQYGIELLELVANIYFGAENKTNRTADATSGPDNVQSFVHWLSTNECKDKVSTKIKVMIMNFEDFCQRGYNKKNADKGPKTIQQLHEEIKKEEEVNKTQRLAYEAEKQRETGNRYPNQRQQYGGRPSLDRKNPQEKRMNAAAASNSTGTSGLPKKNTSLRIAMNDPLANNKSKNPSFFSQQKKDGGSENSGWTLVGGGIKGGNGNDGDSRKSSIERN